jgi:hypothetical protein
MTNLIDLKAKIKQISVYYCKSQNDFGKIVGLDSGLISQMLNPKTPNKEFGVDKLLKILSNFPEINTNWLLKNEGEMIISRNTSVIPITTIDTSKHLPGAVPYYQVDVFAGTTDVFNDQTIHTDLYLSLPALSDCDFACDVRGDSMQPRYTSGDIIVCKRITDYTYIVFGETYLIITPHIRVLKTIRRPTTSGNTGINTATHLRLTSHNPDYDDITITTADLLHLYIVKAKITINAL